MWASLLQEGLGLLDGSRAVLRSAGQELAHHVVHAGETAVLWCDGDHGFDPYRFAELNLVRGFEADHGAQRVLVKRSLTPFQWDTVLTEHLEVKLEEVDAGLVLVLPYDRLFSTDELKPWEQVDYVTYSLAHLRDLAHRHHLPILLGVDVARWRIHHPDLARLLRHAFDHGWHLDESGRVHPMATAGEGPGWFGTRGLGRQTRLTDFLQEDDPVDAALGSPGSFGPPILEQA